MATEPGVREARQVSWPAKLILTLWPFALLVLVEGGLRLVGAYGEPWRSDVVAFADGDRFVPEWEQIPTTKPSGVLRVFTVGGSVTEGYGVQTTFTDDLATDLRAALPDRSVETYNGGRGGFGSHRVLAVVREALAHEPDLVLVVTGQNEFLEPVFYDPDGALGRLERAQAWVRSLRLIRMLHRWLPFEVTPAKVVLPHEFKGNLNYPLIQSDAEVDSQLKLLVFNVERMIDAAQEQGVPIVIVPELSNLLLEPHGALSHAAAAEVAAPRADRAAASARGDWAAVQAADVAILALDPANAEPWFDLGLASLHLGEVDRGAIALRRAVTFDRTGDRATDAIADAILDTARRRGVPSVDLRPAYQARLAQDFAARAPDGTNPFFLDHCHPTEAGHRWITDQIVGEVREALKGR